MHYVVSVIAGAVRGSLFGTVEQDTYYVVSAIAGAVWGPFLGTLRQFKTRVTVVQSLPERCGELSWEQ